MYEVGAFIGALVPTLLISRLLLWLLRDWNGGVQKLLLVHGISLMACALIGGMGMADGGAFVPIAAGARYFFPQAAWFVVDAIRYQQRSQAQPPSNNGTQA